MPKIARMTDLGCELAFTKVPVVCNQGVCDPSDGSLSNVSLKTRLTQSSCVLRLAGGSKLD